MRISTLHIFNLANNSMADANKEIVKTQEQLSTGRKVLTAADDPVAATRIQQLEDSNALVEQYNKNITLAENNLSAEETTLDSINNLIQRIEELAIQAGNTAVLSEGEYSAIASEVDTRVDELFSLVNTRSANGDYIFSGYKSDSPAFSGDKINGYRFVGDEGNINIKVDNNTVISSSDSGKNMFVDVPSANNTISTSANPTNQSNPAATISIGAVVDQEAYDDFYPEDIVITFNDDNPGKNFTVTERSTGKVIEADRAFVSGEELVYNGVSVRIVGNPLSGNSGAGVKGDEFFIDSAKSQDVLTTMLNFRNALEDFDGSQASRDQVEAVVANTITNLSNAQETISETVTKIGARMNTLESTKEQHLDTELVSNEILSDLRDLDYAEAASRLSAQTLILQAAQASFLRISELNLFNRL